MNPRRSAVELKAAIRTFRQQGSPRLLDAFGQEVKLGPPPKNTSREELRRKRQRLAKEAKVARREANRLAAEFDRLKDAGKLDEAFVGEVQGAHERAALAEKALRELR